MTENEKALDLAKKASEVAELAQPVKAGMEEPSTQEDLVIPRAKLLQSNSPEVIDDTERKYSIGMIINSLTGEELPTEFLPIFKFTNWIRWNPRSQQDPNFDPAYDPGSLIWRSDDPNDPRVQAESHFGPDGERPKATKFLNFFSYFPGVPMPVVVSFSNTSFKAGKKLNSLCQFSPGTAIFERKYVLKSRSTGNEKGQYHVLDVEQAANSIADQADQKVAEGWFAQFRPRVQELKVEDGDEW